MGSRSGFDSQLDLDELVNVVDRGSGAVSAATRQANALTNLGLTVTQAELNALHNVVIANGSYIAAGATKTLVAADAGKLVKLDTLAGSVVTLPAASGSGRRYRFFVSVLATSNSHVIQVANGTDFMVGLAFGARVDSSNAALSFATVNSGTVATNSDTITLNRTTTGSVTIGEWMMVEDIAANVWKVEAFLSATGAAFATPFSAAV